MYLSFGPFIWIALTVFRKFRFIGLREAYTHAHTEAFRWFSLLCSLQIIFWNGISFDSSLCRQQNKNARMSWHLACECECEQFVDPEITTWIYHLAFRSKQMRVCVCVRAPFCIGPRLPEQRPEIIRVSCCMKELYLYQKPPGFVWCNVTVEINYVI